MTKALTLSVVQFTPIFGEKSKNLQRLEAMTQGLQTDIVVFPELCTTGYLFLDKQEVDQVAETLDGPSVVFFRKLAHRLKAVVVAGFAERDQINFYNSCLVAVPEDPKPYIYRKTHLFYKERHCFEPGDTGFFVVNDKLRDINIGPMICYDWRFPESARILTLLQADLIVCPANLVTDAWRLVMPARAVENKVYLAVANRCGAEKRDRDEFVFKGNSTIYDYSGLEMKKAGAQSDEVLTVSIFPQKTRDKSFNAVNDVLKDRRPQIYHPLVK